MRLAWCPRGKVEHAWYHGKTEDKAWPQAVRNTGKTDQILQHLVRRFGLHLLSNKMPPKSFVQENDMTQFSFQTPPDALGNCLCFVLLLTEYPRLAILHRTKTFLIALDAGKSKVQELTSYEVHPAVPSYGRRQRQEELKWARDWTHDPALLQSR